MLSEQALTLLQAARMAEKEQTLFYRTLSAEAEERAEAEAIEALNGLLADEQHHLSRVTVRLVELGFEAGEVPSATPSCEFAKWRQVARERERAEIALYESLLRQALDNETAEVLRAILAVEYEHEEHLGGKYTEA